MATLTATNVDYFAQIKARLRDLAENCGLNKPGRGPHIRMVHPCVVLEVIATLKEVKRLAGVDVVPEQYVKLAQALRKVYEENSLNRKSKRAIPIRELPVLVISGGLECIRTIEELTESRLPDVNIPADDLVSPEKTNEEGLDDELP